MSDPCQITPTNPDSLCLEERFGLSSGFDHFRTYQDHRSGRRPDEVVRDALVLPLEPPASAGSRRGASPRRRMTTRTVRPRSRNRWNPRTRVNWAFETAHASIQKLPIRTSRTGPSPSSGYAHVSSAPIANGPPPEEHHSVRRGVPGRSRERLRHYLPAALARRCAASFSAHGLTGGSSRPACAPPR